MTRFIAILALLFIVIVLYGWLTDCPNTAGLHNTDCHRQPPYITQ